MSQTTGMRSKLCVLMDMLYCIRQYSYLAVTNTCLMVFLLQGSYLSVHKGVMKHNG